MDDDCQTLTEDNNPQFAQANEDDDPLIAEVDIYLTRLFSDQLYLFQYPLRPNHLQYETNPTFIGARLKPKNKLVQLDYKLDKQSNFHCRNHEAKVAANWTSSSTECSDKITSIDHLTFSSTNTTLTDNYKRFAVGMITSNGIQLSPLNAIFQLRPDFGITSANLGKTTAQQSTTMSDDDEDPDIVTNPGVNKQVSSTTDDSATDEDNSFKLVTMKFWRPEGRLAREKKLRSYNYFERARYEERWIDFGYYSPNESESIALRHTWTMLYQSNINRLPIRWRKTISLRDYFQLLLCNEQFCLNDKLASHPVESSQSVEQKTVVLPSPTPTKSKKNTKTKSDKTTKKKSKQNRSVSRIPSNSTATLNPDQKAAQTTSNTPLSSVSVPQTIIKQDPETIQNELLSFMRRRFGYRPYFKLSEINIAIKLELISSPSGHPLASGVTEASILRAATEIGAIHVNKKWPKNLKQEPVFINAQMGDKYDMLRRYVAELLEKCDSFQFTELRSRIKQENQTQQFPVHEVKKFVKDHCIPRSSRKGVLYCVKGTLVK